jgi:hypothetical protein
MKTPPPKNTNSIFELSPPKTTEIETNMPNVIFGNHISYNQNQNKSTDAPSYFKKPLKISFKSDKVIKLLIRCSFIWDKSVNYPNDRLIIEKKSDLKEKYRKRVLPFFVVQEKFKKVKIHQK